MPYRKVPLITSHYYHVYNRGIAHQPTFLTKRDYLRFVKTIFFYRLFPQSIRFSKYLDRDQIDKDRLLFPDESRQPQVNIIAFCLMPNHFHLLLSQENDGGISRYLSCIQNSYTRYFNLKNKRDGAIFLNQFKAVQIESDAALMHVSRYIHLNPFTSYLIKDKDKIASYPWSSLPAYVTNTKSLVHTDPVMSLFKNQSNYLSFILDQADYQRELHALSHLWLE